MLVRGFPADAFATNCYLVAVGPGEPCLIIDPGIGVMRRLDALLAEHRLRPAAVLLTHGHLDHTFSVAPVCGARGVTAYIHPADRELLADPAKGLSIDLDALFGGRLPYAEPEDVAELPDGGTITVAGLEITVDHAPGHTRGSVLFRLPGDDAFDASHPSGNAETSHPSGNAEASHPGHTADAGDIGRDDVAAGLPAGAEICLSGDVLFAGSIGRTDLPGGDLETMMASLRDKVLPLRDDTIVLPGHGPATTIGRERATNPYLLEVIGRVGPAEKVRGW